MPASQAHVTSSTPPGANLVGGGATFSVWAPGAHSVSVALAGAAAIVLAYVWLSLVRATALRNLVLAPKPS